MRPEAAESSHSSLESYRVGWGHGEAAPAATAECLQACFEIGMDLDGSCGRGVKLMCAVHGRARRSHRGRSRGPECELMDSRQVMDPLPHASVKNSKEELACSVSQGVNSVYDTVLYRAICV